MNNAKLQLEIVSPTTIKCGHIEWFALDTKLVGKVKKLLEDNERLIEESKRIEELVNINEKLSLALESAENKLNLISQYIRSLPTFHIGYEKDKDDIEKTMYASEFNFVDEIISLLENGGK